MYRIRLATGHETVFETVEDIARGVSTGTITPECSIFHAKAGKWLPITVHPLYQTALDTAEEMAARPARPRRISRPLPRVDTPSPERTAPGRTRVQGPDPQSGADSPPAEASASPAAHELPTAGAHHAVADAAADEEARPTQTDGRSQDPAEETGAETTAAAEPADPPKLNDGLIDLGPIVPTRVEGPDELIIERGTPPPDFQPAPSIVPQPAEARTNPERTRRPEPPAQPKQVEPPPAPKPEPRVAPRDADELEPTGPAAPMEGKAEAPSIPPESKPMKRAEGPLPIGAGLGDFDDESKVDAMLPPPRPPGERRDSGAQPAVSSGPHRRPAVQRPPAFKDPFGHHSKRKKSASKTPALAAAGFGGLLVAAWVLKAFVLGGGADPVEAATRRDTVATLGASTMEESAANRQRSSGAMSVDSLNDSAVVATVLDSLRMAAAAEAIRDPLPESEAAGSAYVAAYSGARTDLEISLAAVDIPSLLAPQRWSTAEGALASQRDVRAIRAALRQFRTREAEIESMRPESELSLRETTPQVRRADIMLAALDSLFGWLGSQGGRYVLVEDAIIFRGDSTQEATYAGLKERVLDEAYRPEAPPPSVATVVQAMDSTLFPTPSSIPDAPALPTFSLPADSTGG